MKPVLILQHMNGDSPSYLGTWLAARGVPYVVLNSAGGDAFPASLASYRALAILGGEMSANDESPSLRQAEALIREALREAVPTLGHCLGGQLMSRALGGEVCASSAPEVGWQPMQVYDTPTARAWLGAPGEVHVFQWHYEAFSLPAAGESLAASAACPHQAFAIGPHLAMQFHVEIDAAKLEAWSGEHGPRYLAALDAHASVQTAAQMRSGVALFMKAHQRLADRIYARWLGAAAGR